MEQPVESQNITKFSNGGRMYSARPRPERANNEKLVVHVGNIPPMMPEEIVLQAAQQFGAVKEFHKINKQYEKAYEYAPAFGFLTFEDETSTNRALKSGSMTVGNSRLSLNPRRPRNEYRSHVHPRLGSDMVNHNLPKQAQDLPDRPTSSRPRGLTHMKKNSTGLASDSKTGINLPQRNRANGSSCTIYGLPDTFAVNNLIEKALLYGRVINGHIFDYRNQDGQRFGTVIFDSSINADEFYQKENGGSWSGSMIRITFEPFHVARKNNAVQSRSGPINGQTFQRYEPQEYNISKRYSYRGHRYGSDYHGRPNHRNVFGTNTNFHQNGSKNQSGAPVHQSYQQNAHFYDQNNMGYQGYPQIYGEAVSPTRTVMQPLYDPVMQSPPPSVGYGHQMAAPMMQPTYQQPTPNQMGTNPQIFNEQYPFTPVIDPIQSSDGIKLASDGESPESEKTYHAEFIDGLRKVSSETSLTIPTSKQDGGVLPSDTPVIDSQPMFNRPVVIKPEHYLQAGYSYGEQMPENVRPVDVTVGGQQSSHFLHASYQDLNNGIKEIMSITVPETDKPEDPTNLYIKNLDDDIIYKDEHLEDLCKKYGKVVSVSVPTYSNGVTKGFGFVKFAEPEQALQAKTDLDLKFVGRKRVFVSWAESGDVRHDRLAVFYRKDKSKLSPPDPLIEAANKKAELEKAQNAAIDKSYNENEKQTQLSTDAPAGEKSGEVDNAERAFVASQSKPANENRDLVDDNELKSRELAGEDKASTTERDSRDQLTATTVKAKQGRKLSVEELKELDPAIKSIGERPSSESTANVLLSSREPSPPTSITKDPIAASKKLRQLLHGLQTIEIKSFADLPGNDNSDKKPSSHAPVVSKYGPCDSEGKQNTDGGKNSSDIKSVEKCEASEGAKEVDAEATVDPERPDTRNSASSTSSRISQEEFVEVLRGKYGETIPAAIRATDVLEAVEDYVKSRDISQRASPNTENEEPSNAKASITETSRATEQIRNVADETEERLNLVAPIPSRKVSITNISSSEGAIAKESQTLANQNPRIESSQPDPIPNADPLIKSEGNMQKQRPDGIQTIPTLDSVTPKYYQHVEGWSGSPRRDISRHGQQKQLISGRNAGFERSNSFQYNNHDQYDGPFHSPYEPYSQGQNKFYPGPEQIPGSHQQFHMGFGDNNSPQTAPHAPGIICDGPCCSQSRFPPNHPEMHPAMFPGPMPFFDPRHHPTFFDGQMGAHQHQHWPSYTNGHPGFHHPQPGYPQSAGTQNFPYPPGHKGMVPPDGGMNNNHRDGGYPGYGQHPMMQPHFGGPMYYEQGMGNGPQPFPGHDPYRSQHGGHTTPIF